MSHPTQENNNLAQAYGRVVRDLLLRRTQVGYVLVLVLMPTGAALDWFVCEQPRVFWSILYARILCDLALAPLFVLVFLPWGRRHTGLLSGALVLAPVAAMCWMVYELDGAQSSYYAGLNLMIVGTCLLLPYTGKQAALYCGAVIGLYAAACASHISDPTGVSILFNNLFFIALTSVVCVTACHYASLQRFSDFQLRHQLAAQHKALETSYDQLAEMDRLRSEFFANISHELRTPLTLILSPIEALLQREPPLPETVGESLILVKNNGLRLMKLINDLLEIIRLEEGKLQINPKPIDLTTFVPGIADSIRHLAEMKKIVICVQSPTHPLIVRGEPSRLEKVLLNLLTNAIKFTPPGGRITVSWGQTQGQAQIEVQDTGIGIAPNELPYVFDRFRQADGSSTRKYQGVGLGLALAKELVEEHHGSLAARSRVGEGTVFSVRLPLDHSEADTTTLLPNTKPPDTKNPQDEADPFARTFQKADRNGSLIQLAQGPTFEEAGSGSVRVLVIDDEPDMRRFLVSILSDQYRVLQAPDGVSGLRIAREQQPDLVLLDLMLPGMDGLDVCRALRKHDRTQDVKIILLTARVDEAAKIEALERGTDDFLTKPFSTIEVKTRIKALLRTAALQKDLHDQNHQLKQTLSQLKATESQLVQSEKMNALGSLAAGLLHEINNPLNYTMAALQLLQESVDASDEDTADTLHDIDQGMQRIRNIVTDLRAFAYPQCQGQREPFDLAEALDTAMRFTAHIRNGQEIKQDLSSAGLVRGSKTHISQVFVNLLANALRAVEPVKQTRPPQIRVHTQRSGHRLHVHVCDNGVGIEPQVITRVFDPFYTTQEVGQGMGLGLSICHTIVKNHGGTIRVTSDKDQGTEVSFDLPLAQEN